MESRKRKPNLNSYPPSPLPNPPSSIFRDISNFKTPKQPSRTPSFQSSPQFFTASKNTPISSSCRGYKTLALKSKAARRLKAFELEQSKSARKAQSEKEKSLKSLARSLTVWLNFLFENPSSCGCDPANFTGETDGSDLSLGTEVNDVLVNNGKRESVPGRGVGVDGPWRGPKRQRGLLWRTEGSDDQGKNVLSDSTFSGLRTSLQEICSFEDLQERMRMYLSFGGCKDIFETMTQVTKNIDEGRLKMRASCPIVSDVGMKEKAMRILMCYNPIWLRIGLYIILGGDSLLPNGDVNSEQENTFLKMVIEKQFFSHTGLAKSCAYNKQVDGLYRPGYYEKLGNVLLKRFLLLVIIIDRAKSHTSLPLKYGIDGMDGGSPPLFSSKSNIKSSRQLIIDFLSSDVMHGEGNLLAHLVIVGYKVTYQQNPLVEYDFKISDLFEDLRDGVRLCRAIQLLKHDSSILMKVVVPSDTQKKSLVNCGIAMQYLKQAGVPLLDEDGTEIMGEDVINGDKELTLSLLWNMFVHLQLPLLINKTLLSEEISNIRGVVGNSSTLTLLELLLSWIQAICETYEFNVESHSSLLDGKAMWCLLDYYFRKEHDCSCSFKDPDGTKTEVSIMSAIEYTDAVHNFILSQKLTSLLGNFPEVLQVSDILEHNGACNGQSVIVLLVFLSVQLLVKRNMDKLNFHKLLGFSCQSPSSRRSSTVWNNDKDPTRDFKTVMAWWQEMAQQNGKCNLKTATSSKCFLTGKKGNNVQRENAATIIQSNYRRLVERRNYLRIIDAVLVLQSFALAWVSAKKKVSLDELGTRSKLARGKHLEKYGMYVTFMVDRHYFVNLKKSITIIQRAARAWIGQKRNNESTLYNEMYSPDLINAATVIRSCMRGWIVRSVFDRKVKKKVKSLVISEEDRVGDLQAVAAINIQHCWRSYVFGKSMRCQHSAATKIQSHYRGWLTRKSFACKKGAIKTIQRSFRCLRSRRNSEIYREESAIIMQAHARGWIARRQAYKEKQSLIKIQSYCRGWLQRKEFLLQKDAATRVGDLHAVAAIKIQHYWRSYVFGKSMRRQHSAATKIQSHYRGRLTRKSFACKKRAIKTIQRSFRCLRSRRNSEIYREESAIIIQAHARRWIARRQAYKEKQSSIKIQSYCRGWLQRKEFLLQKEAATMIQSVILSMNFQKEFVTQRLAAINIQCYVRGENTRKRLLGSFCCHKTSNHDFLGLELKIFVQSVVKLQRWWRNVLQVRLKTKSTVIIQSHVRGWIAREIAKREKHGVIVIQSHWKGYLARKDAKGQLVDLRLRMQKSAANIDNSRRLINRLVAALSELLSMRSVSGILHTCATLDVATELSQRCCEELVAAGAVATLLKLIRSVSRSIPDQQVLKHALSTLRNLARYPHVTQILVETPGCLETVILEFLRNKEEGYFIASELLKKICVHENGAKAIRKSPALLRRLNNLAEELARKAGHDKR
ncbi:hypothetical protein BUALT_Bualt03G0075000 [Buddleja alternifolia]|uniref:Calponin-homology (CH) domain-containing protein n=1 Tax=Buddleja alternifolia TaxID=168488 RepID=A0AAV6XRY9_9LAMI|nr:hypothetical protein BUALT_Bualt03G0075000 [Buddleja alternifolia]